VCISEDSWDVGLEAANL